MSKYQLSVIDTQIKELQEKREKIVQEMEAKKTAFDRYMDTYSGRKLLGKHNLQEYGVWKVSGEDPNCDLGGSHHQPNLGLYEGTLEKVIKYAVDLPGFWQWGGGGDIEKVKEPAVKKL